MAQDFYPAAVSIIWWLLIQQNPVILGSAIYPAADLKALVDTYEHATVLVGDC